jgi:hypothetical protein
MCGNKGIVFPANLIVMGTQGIDVILGMNWLDKYQAVISCDKRTIKFESIKVLSEFPDVFPKDLPGMPPERKVEFAIELLPGTAPIFKRAYRISGLELVELKE